MRGVRVNGWLAGQRKQTTTDAGVSETEVTENKKT